MPSSRLKGKDMAKNSFALWAAIALGISPQAALLAQENNGTIVVTGQRQAGMATEAVPGEEGVDVSQGAAPVARARERVRKR